VIYVCIFNTTLKSEVFLNKSQMYFTYSTVLLLDYLCPTCWGTRERSAWKYKGPM